MISNWTKKVIYFLSRKFPALLNLDEPINNMITSTPDDVFLIMPTCEISQETFEQNSLYFMLFENSISNQWKGVTIRDLLSHRVCLTDTDVNLVLGSKNDTREEFAFTRRFLTKQCDFRTKYKVLWTKILFVFINFFISRSV